LVVSGFAESVLVAAPELGPVVDSPDEPPSSRFFALALAVEPRSFFAQPDPLKWIAGVTNAFVIVPSAPHSGQNRGPWSLMPWMNSVVR
jgi:hypothetical protein